MHLEARASGKLSLSICRECLGIVVEPTAGMGWTGSPSTAMSCGHLGTSDSEVTSYSLWAGSCLKSVFINSSFGPKPHLLVYRIVMTALCVNNRVKTAWPPMPSVPLSKKSASPWFNSKLQAEREHRDFSKGCAEGFRDSSPQVPVLK